MTDGPQQLTGYRLRDYDDLLRTLRRAWLGQGLTQAQLAEKLPISRAQIANVLLGHSETPARKMAALAAALGYDLALIPRAEPAPGQLHCDRCGGPCRDESTTLDEDAPSGPLSSPVAAEQPPVGGTGRAEAAETISGGCDCGHDGLDPMFHFDCPVARRYRTERKADQA